MLSVLVFDAEEPFALSVTLSSLVGGVVEGVLREVVVVAPGGEGVSKVADHAGCAMQTLEDLRQSASTLKGDWVLVLRAGDRLPADWPERAALHIEGEGRASKLRAGQFPLSSRPASGWRRWVRRKASAPLVPRSHLVKRLAEGAPLDVVARGIASLRLARRED